jgi:hypothetical protein
MDCSGTPNIGFLRSLAIGQDTPGMRLLDAEIVGYMETRTPWAPRDSLRTETILAVVLLAQH